MKTKKINLLFLTFAGFCASMVSCNKDTSTTKVSFTNATMKPWFNTYCASCHESGKSAAGKWLYNASDYDASIKSEISTIYKEVYTNKSMPQGMQLSTSELASFKTWYDGGYTAN